MCLTAAAVAQPFKLSHYHLSSLAWSRASRNLISAVTTEQLDALPTLNIQQNGIK